MTLLRVQHVLKGKSGLPKDQFVNNFYFDDAVAGNLDDQPVDAAAAVKEFFSASHPTHATRLSQLLSPEIRQNGHDIKVYDMTDPTPRVPVHVETWNLPTAPNGTALPGEVAMCLSFKAATVSGVNAARRRGRVFVGPLNDNTGAADGNSAFRPTSIFQQVLENAASAMKAIANSQGLVWVVHSPTTGPVARWAVAEVWTDDSYDTIRSRGTAPTSKRTLALVQAALAA